MIKVNDTTPKGRMLIANSDLVELHQKPDGKVTEEDLKTVLKRYNLRDGLITLGRASNYIFSNGDPNNIGRAVHREPQTGAIVSQFALAYLANMLLISGANDYKSKFIGEKDKDNWLILCNIYSNQLIQPELKDDFGVMDKTKLRSMMIRMYFEQMTYQFAPAPLISRTIVLFNELAKKIQPGKFENLSTIFEKETGLNIYDYICLAMAVWAGAQKTSTFRIDMFTRATISKMKDVLTEDKLKKFLSILKADYKTFRETDANLNKNLKPELTKTRFNPLHIFPIIETDAKNLGDPYVIPNVTCFTKKAFGGLYWWFHLYFEKNNKQQDFRNYFGYVFQEYVGIILKGVFGDDKVHPEVVYDKDKKFIDWWVKRDEKIYLFEVKANQFSLASMQTGDNETIANNEIKKIVDAVEQVYRRVADIPRHKELKMFQGRTTVPFVIFMNVPFITGNMYEELILEALKQREKDKNLPGLKDFVCYLLNVEEFELFDGVVGKIELEDVYPAVKKDLREGFLSIIAKAKGSPLRNSYLDKVYMEFWKTIGVLPDNSEPTGGVKE